MSDRPTLGTDAAGFDKSSRPEFYEYYAKGSVSEETLRRYEALYDLVFRVRGTRMANPGPLAVADIGCGAGTQCLMWARRGHRVYGIDVNEPLLQLARARSTEEGLDIRFDVGSATELPLDDTSIDACLVPELLEHVAEWRACLGEFARILRPGGVLYVSTTNRWCPIQHEFELPLYSWYPDRLKRHYERLARTTRPELANYATYPAVNWFTFGQLRRELDALGIEALDRFEVMDLASKSSAVRWLVGAFRPVPPLRWLARATSASTIAVGLKR